MSSQVQQTDQAIERRNRVASSAASEFQRQFNALVGQRISLLAQHTAAEERNATNPSVSSAQLLNAAAKNLAKIEADMRELPFALSNGVFKQMQDVSAASSRLQNWQTRERATLNESYDNLLVIQQVVRDLRPTWQAATPPIRPIMGADRVWEGNAVDSYGPGGWRFATERSFTNKLKAFTYETTEALSQGALRIANARIGVDPLPRTVTG